MMPSADLDVLVNGVSVGRARLGLPNPGLEVERREPNCIISGFEHWVDPVLGLVGHVLCEAATGCRVFEWSYRFRSSNARPARETAGTAPLNDPIRTIGMHGRRREELLAAIVAPRSSELNLVVFTHQLDYGGGQFWLAEIPEAENPEPARGYACTVISFKDGPLRDDSRTARHCGAHHA